ncbi:hypothetical protein ACIA6D_23735 [Streptomyces cacaoi]
MTADRYRLTLTSDGRPMMRGWWASDDAARVQLAVWVGSWGELPGARITLDDQEMGETVTTWPEPTAD